MLRLVHSAGPCGPANDPDLPKESERHGLDEMVDLWAKEHADLFRGPVGAIEAAKDDLKLRLAVMMEK
jgi:hypothetical protein